MAQQQVDFFHAGTVGFLVKFLLVDRKDVPILLVGNTEGTLNSITLYWTRPDKTTFTRNLVLPGAIADPAGIIQYTLLTGDLSVPGGYEIRIVLVFNSTKILPLQAAMRVLV